MKRVFVLYLLTTIGALFPGNSTAESLPMNAKVIANSVIVDRGMEIARLKGLETTIQVVRSRGTLTMAARPFKALRRHPQVVLVDVCLAMGIESLSAVRPRVRAVGTVSPSGRSRSSTPYSP